MFKTILGFDIEDFSKDGESIALERKRMDLELVIKNASEISKFRAISEIQSITLDTGDGLFFALDTRNYAAILDFFHHIENTARKLNTIRFRGIIHMGDCTPTKSFFANSGKNDNLVGLGIIETARYLDCLPLKELLKIESYEKFVYGISSKVFCELKGQSFFDDSDFTEYPVTVKKFNNSIFLHTYKQSINDCNSINKSNTFAITENFEVFLKSNALSELYNNFKNGDASSLFVFPEFLRDNPVKPSEETIDSFQYLKDYCDKPINLIISGEEQIGKTALCKNIFNLFYDTKSLLPLYLCLNEKYSGTIVNAIKRAIRDEYNKTDNEVSSLRKILIIDDFHLIEPRYQRRIVEELSDMPNFIIIFIVDSIYNINFLEKEIEYNYESLTIKEFGPRMRHRLIEKWMETEALVDKNYKTIDELTDYVTNILLKGLVPSIPINILVILEEKKYFNPLHSEITSKGHCYQALIYIALRKAEIKDSEIDIYLSFLENLANYLFDKNIDDISEDDFELFYRAYIYEYNQPIEKIVFIKKLLESKILKLNSIGTYCFSSQYIYYFFVSKYLADHSKESLVYKKIEVIYNNLDKIRNGYLGVFIVHHLRDEKILDEIEINLLVQYDKYDNATMNIDEVEFLQKHIETLSKLTMNSRNISYKEREEQLRIENQREEEEIKSRKLETEQDKDDISIIDEIKQLRKALRTVEVMGHILKTKPGSFRKELQKKYFLEAVSVYSRITKRFLVDFRDNENDFIEYFMDRISYFNKGELSSEETFNLARRYFCQYNLLNYYACIHRSVSILCSEQIVQIVSEACDEIDTQLAYFIKLQCQMWYKKKIPINEIKTIYKSLKGLQAYVLKDLIIRYCEMHDVKIDEKQKISNILSIELKRLNRELI
jgi:hypothetical protein